MDTLLAALGLTPGLASRVYVASLMAGGTLVVLFAIHITSPAGTLAAATAHALLWVLWFGWLGWWFPWSREKRLRSNPESAYRDAFFADILPGVCLGFAQLGRPVLVASLAPPSFLMPVVQGTLGVATIAVGTTLLVLGHHSMSPDVAAFVHEYLPTARLVTTGIYARVSHPMYLGAALMSFGVGVIAGGAALGLGAINLATVGVYWRVEDWRLARVLGESFEGYRRSVGRGDSEPAKKRGE